MRKRKKRKAIALRESNPTYEQIFEGVWEHGARRDGPSIACCDCGLVHDFHFRVIDRGGRRVIQYKVTRNNRSTGQIRRWNKIKISRGKSWK